MTEEVNKEVPEMEVVETVQTEKETQPQNEQPEFFIIKKEGMEELQALIGHIESSGKSGLLNEAKALDRIIGTLNGIILRPAPKQ